MGKGATAMGEYAAEKIRAKSRKTDERLVSGITILSAIIGGTAFGAAIGAAIGGPVATGIAALVGTAAGIGANIWSWYGKRQQRAKNHLQDPLFKT